MQTKCVLWGGLQARLAVSFVVPNDSRDVYYWHKADNLLPYGPPNLTTWVAKDHAISPGQMNLFANITCSRPRLSTDPDLITREGTRPAFKQDGVPSGEHCREPPLECGISIQDFLARSVRAENGPPRLDYTRHYVLLERCHESRRRLLEFRHQRFATNSAFGFGLEVPLAAHLSTELPVTAST